MMKNKGIMQKAESAKMEEKRIPKRLVEVQFDGGMLLSYLSDVENIEIGDLVTVEGKLEKEIGLVKQVKKSFKIPKFEMKWIEHVLNTDISGNYFKLNADMVSLNCVLTAEKFITMYAGLKYEENQGVGEDEMDLNLADFEKSEIFDNEVVKIKGKELYKANAVAFLSLQDGVGKAIVRGGDWYEIDFRYVNERITYMACDCPCFGECKHEIALLYKLRETLQKLGKMTNGENFVLCRRECFNVILSNGRGNVTIAL